MPIIGKVGRRQFRVRALNAVIHIALFVGGITMIYPFLIMVSGSFKSRVDSKVFSTYPKYFTNEEMLFRKYVETRYNEASGTLWQQYHDRYMDFEFVKEPSRPVKRRYDDFRTFLEQTKASHSDFDFSVSEQNGAGIYPRNNRLFRNTVKTEEDDDLDRVNKKYGTNANVWDQININVIETGILQRRFTGDYSIGLAKRFISFKHSLPLWQRVYLSLDGDFANRELKPLNRNKLQNLNKETGASFKSWREATLSRRMPDGPLKKHWINYVKKDLNLNFIKVDTEATPLYRKYLKNKYGDIGLLNRTYSTEYKSFEDIGIIKVVPRKGARQVDWDEFVKTMVPPENIEVTSLEFRYRDYLKKKYETIKALNIAHKMGLSAFDDIRLSEIMPENNIAKQKDWLEFVRINSTLNSVTLKMGSQRDFQEYISEKYFSNKENKIDIVQFNKEFGTHYMKAEDIYPSAVMPENSAYRDVWSSFVKDRIGGQFLTVDAAREKENWKKFLRNKYDSIDMLNSAWGLVYTDFNTVSVDHWTNDYFMFLKHKKNIFWEFVKRNYIMVLDVMLFNGRAIINTIIYCLLSIFIALLVNPLAAYAMSRYKLPTTYKIILLCMLTMAFPPMVMGIPQFLLIKKLGLLNTFAALVLPVAANGYFIFLLKGFFDSLPSELFEAATIDGASEWQIFWKVAMSLSKPIMAVIALQAFNIAYRNFMLAFIVCQDKSMWTMMVHIYQLMQRSSGGVGFAALVLASIPTLLVFIFAQDIIIRGIVVPTEK